MAPKTIPKISVQIWRPLLAKFDAKLEAACLRRDAFLNKVLEVELPHLDSEVCLPNSAASYSYVASKLERLDRKVVSLALRADLIAQINDICGRKRIVRDAFFNRLFFLLAADSKVIDNLLFGSSEWRSIVWSEFRNDGPFFQNGFYPLDPIIDPFWAFRIGFEVCGESDDLIDFTLPEDGRVVQVKKNLGDAIAPPDSVYTIIFEKKLSGIEADLVGLNCYMPDWNVPGHAAQKSYQVQLDELLGDLL